MRTALASIRDAVILADADGAITFMNPVAAQLTGRSEADALGAPVPDLFRVVYETTREAVEDLVGQAMLARRPVALQRSAMLVTPDGRETLIDADAVPLLNDQGAPAGAVLVFRDVAEKRRAEESTERLAAIIESSDDIIVSNDLHGIITGWNKGAEMVLGYRADDVLGKHVSMLMPEDHLEDTHKILSRISQGERVDHYETKRRRKDGQVIDVSLTVSPIRNSYGEIIGASKVGRDITERRRIEELRERLAAIVESSDDMIVSKNLDGVITSWNRGAEKLLGYSADEMIGKHVSSIMPPERAEDYEKILSKIRRGESVDHYETRRLRKDGSIVDVSLTISPIRNAEGQIIGASKIGRDVTQQKALEEQRREADRRKDEFLAMLAHELRNPLASINNAVQLFSRQASDDDLKQAREIVQRQVKHLARLIDDLLDVSRITRGKIVLRKELVDISPIVANAVESVRPFMEQRRHELVVSLCAGTLRVEADPLRVEQMIVNLLTNAAKYTDAGGTIRLAVTREGDMASISVKDNGIGLPAELLPRVFDLFVQGDRSLARTEGGLGIGLTLVKKLAEMHDGSVEAASAGPGAGSEFTIRLPACAATPPPRPAPARPAPRTNRRAARVLVVDDNVDTAEGLGKLLRLLGHEVRTAYDGRAAIAVAQELDPEIILLDLGLPNIDGYEVARTLRKDLCRRDALLVAVSGYGQDSDVQRSIESGFDHRLVKPIDFDALMTVLAEAR